MFRAQPIEEDRCVGIPRDVLRIEGRLGGETLLALDTQSLGKRECAALVGDLERLGGLALLHEEVDVAAIDARGIGEERQTQVLPLDIASRIADSLERDFVFGQRGCILALCCVEVGELRLRSPNARNRFRSPGRGDLGELLSRPPSWSPL